MSFPVDNFHTQIVLSQDPDTKYSSFGENCKVCTESLWPVKVPISLYSTVKNLFLSK